MCLSGRPKGTSMILLLESEFDLYRFVVFENLKIMLLASSLQTGHCLVPEFGIDLNVRFRHSYVETEAWSDWEASASTALVASRLF